MAIDFTRSQIAFYYATRCPEIKQTGAKEWRGKCPIHKGDRDSFAIQSETGLAHCHSACGRGWDIISFEQEISGGEFLTAKASVFDLVGKSDEKKPQLKAVLGPLDRIYDYCDVGGTVLYQVMRYKPAKSGDQKEFRQRRPDGNGGYIPTVRDLEPVPYNLPAVAQANFVFIVEGEKDVENLRQIGLVGSCNNGGAGKFASTLAQYFVGKIIAIIPDNDDVGREHAQLVAERLYPVAKSVKVIEIPGLRPKGDVTDYLEAGGKVEGLRALYAAAPFWNPTQRIDPEDRHLRTLRQEYDIAGNMDRFWDMSLRAGIPTPWMNLTRALGGGLLDGEVYAIGGNSGIGKTSLGLQFAIKALRSGRGVLMFSMEMDWRAVMHRMVAIEARVDLNEFRELQSQSGDSEAAQKMRFALGKYTLEFMDMPMTVSRKARVTPGYILKESARLKEKLPKLDLIIVDHLQLMTPDTKAGTEYEKFTAISRAVKQTAVEAGVPVLLMSQTSRTNSHEKRELEMSDLRGSGAIEEDLAAAFLIYPDREDLLRAKEEGRLAKGPIKAWCKVDKNRYGPSGLYVPLIHHKSFTRFDLLSEDKEYEQQPFAATA